MCLSLLERSKHLWWLRSPNPKHKPIIFVSWKLFFEFFSSRTDVRKPAVFCFCYQIVRLTLEKMPCMNTRCKLTLCYSHAFVQCASSPPSGSAVLPLSSYCPPPLHQMQLFPPLPSVDTQHLWTEQLHISVIKEILGPKTTEYRRFLFCGNC